MSMYVIKIKPRSDELYHYNHNHDARGRFAKSPGGHSSRLRESVKESFKPGPKGSASPAEKTTRATGDILSTTRHMVARKKKSKKQDYSHLSNAELQKRINRLQMEQRYSDLTNPGYSKRKQRALDFLDVAGDIMALGVSAAVIGTQVYRIKH